jgi:hypothetical protein
MSALILPGLSQGPVGEFVAQVGLGDVFVGLQRLRAVLLGLLPFGLLCLSGPLFPRPGRLLRLCSGRPARFLGLLGGHPGQGVGLSFTIRLKDSARTRGAPVMVLTSSPPSGQAPGSGQRCAEQTKLLLDRLMEIDRGRRDIMLA